jgi:hypothetical protein
MNEDLDLTSSRPQKKWFTKGRFLALILIVAAVLAGYLILVRSHNPAPDSSEYEEDQLPAIKVVILNGCGFEQLASEFAAAISQNNIEVVSLGDTPRPIYDKSIIVIRKGDMQDLKRLQKMTGITRWTSAQNEYHSADFDIIVGRDYESYIK